MTIDTHIPPPPLRDRSPLLTELREAFRKMKPGHSVVVDIRTNHQIYDAARQVGIYVRTRKLDGNGFRVWRLK